MIKWGSCVGKKPKFFGLNPLLSLDIDDQFNFDICEMIFINKIFKKSGYISKLDWLHQIFAGKIDTFYVRDRRVYPGNTRGKFKKCT